MAALGLVLLLLVAWRSGVNAGAGQLPYRAVGSAPQEPSEQASR
jgi:hypothetical protein